MEPAAHQIPPVISLHSNIYSSFGAVVLTLQSFPSYLLIVSALIKHWSVTVKSHLIQRCQGRKEVRNEVGRQAPVSGTTKGLHAHISLTPCLPPLLSKPNNSLFDFSIKFTKEKMTWPQGTQRREKWQNTCSWKISKAHNVCFLLLLWQWSVSPESSALLTVFEHFFSQEVIDFIAQGFQVLCKTFCSTFFPQIHFYLFPLFEKSTVACFFWYFLLHSKDFSFSSSTSLL